MDVASIYPIYPISDISNISDISDISDMFDISIGTAEFKKLIATIAAEYLSAEY